MLSLLPRWSLALLTGLGPLGAEVLLGLGHAQVCACCQTDESEGCCGEDRVEREPTEPLAVPAQDCGCALVTSSAAWACAPTPRASESRPAPRAELERCHRTLWLARVELSPCTIGDSSPAPPGASVLLGLRGMSGSARASALGVLRL